MSALAFLVLALAAVLSSLLVVGSRNPVVSALWLALAFAAVAGIFFLLHAEFLGAVQIMVYAGAILVFVLFVIMLLNLTRLKPAEGRPVQRWLGSYLAVLVLVLLGFGIQMTPSFGPPVQPQPQVVGNTAALGALLYTRYLFPFELVSVLLTAAVVGAWVLAHKREAGK